MLSFLVDDIPQEGLEIKEEKEPSSFGLKDDRFISYTGTVTLSLMIERVKEKVKAGGEVEFKVRLICARCLEPFFQEVKTLLDIIYEPESSRGILRKEAFLAEEEPDSFYYGEEGVIKLGDAVREYILLSLPLKPLCTPGCLGLCSSCGKNLNQGSCSCEREKTDSRFKKLKDYSPQTKSVK